MKEWKTRDVPLHFDPIGNLIKRNVDDVICDKMIDRAV